MRTSRELEAAIDAFEKELAPLKRFILPGGTPAAASLPRGAHGVPARGARARWRSTTRSR